MKRFMSLTLCLFSLGASYNASARPRRFEIAKGEIYLFIFENGAKSSLTKDAPTVEARVLFDNDLGSCVLKLNLETGLFSKSQYKEVSLGTCYVNNDSIKLLKDMSIPRRFNLANTVRLLTEPYNDNHLNYKAETLLEEYLDQPKRCFYRHSPYSPGQVWPITEIVPTHCNDHYGDQETLAKGKRSMTIPVAISSNDLMGDQARMEIRLNLKVK